LRFHFRQREDIIGELENQIVKREHVLEKLRETEESFRLLVEGIRDCAIYRLDPNGFVTTWNTGAQRIKGYTAEEIIGNHFSCFYTPEDVQSNNPERALQIAAAEGKYEEENLRVRKNGSIFWAAVLISPLRDSTGELRGFAKVVRDITERKEAEQRLREKDRLATLGTTAAVFAHEVGNTLNGLSTSLQVITDLINSAGNPDPLLAETIEMAHQDMQRLTSLLGDYRSLAKPQTLKFEPSDLRQITEEVLGPATNGCKASGISVTYDFDEDLPLVPVDREKIRQVVLNVCKNAVEAMPGGGILSCKAYRENDRFVLEISDTGIGIPDGLDVFQLFKTTKPDGTGLGLPIVEQIISEHRGTVDFSSQVGKGTTFRISLPLC
jgi:PAS domain S-box-containing protein